MFGGISDIRILRDPKRFQGMAASWKYEGKDRFFDLKQANGEVNYLSRKVSELKEMIAELKEDAEEQIQKYEAAEGDRQKAIARIDDLKTDIAELDDDIEKSELDKKERKEQEIRIKRLLD